MFRNFTSFFAIALWASVALCASAQQPPPEGAPQAANPYGQPYSPERHNVGSESRDARPCQNLVRATSVR